MQLERLEITVLYLEVWLLLIKGFLLCGQERSGTTESQGVVSGRFSALFHRQAEIGIKTIKDLLVM